MIAKPSIHSESLVTFQVASCEEDIVAIRQLFIDYAAGLPFDISFQGFTQELATLPGTYASTRGTLLLARVGGTPAACIGLRPFQGTVGEVKRLYVVPEYRGHGLARALISRLLQSAQEIGYRELVLDTLATMHTAIALYTSYGFAPTDAYYANPHPDARYFRATLPPSANTRGPS